LSILLSILCVCHVSSTILGVRNWFSFDIISGRHKNSRLVLKKLLPPMQTQSRVRAERRIIGKAQCLLFYQRHFWAELTHRNPSSSSNTATYTILSTSLPRAWTIIPTTSTKAVIYYDPVGEVKSVKQLLHLEGFPC
jgi:hypothetical protein